MIKEFRKFKEVLMIISEEKKWDNDRVELLIGYVEYNELDIDAVIFEIIIWLESEEDEGIDNSKYISMLNSLNVELLIEYQRELL